MLSEQINDVIVPGYLLYLKDLTFRTIYPTSADLHGILAMRNRMAADLNEFDIENFPRMFAFRPTVKLFIAVF